MQTSASTRTDRLHALYMRNARRFRDVAFAARLAGDQLDAITPKDPKWAPLRSIQTRAIAQMEHLSRRSIKLARAQVAAAMGGAAHA